LRREHPRPGTGYIGPRDSGDASQFVTARVPRIIAVEKGNHRIIQPSFGDIRNAWPQRRSLFESHNA
jgi:hypothetical protein